MAEKQQKSRTFDLVLIAFMSAVIALCSWISIPVGAVPVTMQTFAVVACSVLLGMKKGTLAVAVYILLGVVGLPVFSLFTGGIGAIMSATGGYILGFVFIPLAGGFFSCKFKNKFLFDFIGNTIGLLLCYITGTLWYVFVYLGNTGETGVFAVLTACVLPYIIPDLVKTALACWIAKAIKSRIGALI